MFSDWWIAVGLSSDCPRIVQDWLWILPWRNSCGALLYQYFTYVQIRMALVKSQQHESITEQLSGNSEDCQWYGLRLLWYWLNDCRGFVFGLPTDFLWDYLGRTFGLPRFFTEIAWPVLFGIASSLARYSTACGLVVVFWVSWD